MSYLFGLLISAFAVIGHVLNGYAAMGSFAAVAVVRKAAPKKSTAVAKVTKVEPFMVLNAKGEFASMTPAFVASVQSYTSELGDLLLSYEEKAKAKKQIAVNLVVAYDAYKKATDGSVPKFVHTYWDSSLPVAYGKPDSDDRKKLTHSPVFRGIEALIKVGRKAMEAQATRKALIEADIDPDNADEVSDHNTQERKDKAAKFQRTFNACMVRLAKEVSRFSIEKFVADVLRKVDRKGELTAAGKTIVDSAVIAVLGDKGAKASDAMADQTKFVESLTAAKGDNAKIQEILKSYMAPVAPAPATPKAKKAAKRK